MTNLQGAHIDARTLSIHSTSVECLFSIHPLPRPLVFHLLRLRFVYLHVLPRYRAGVNRVHVVKQTNTHYI